MEEHKINCATNDNNYQHLGCTCGADNINALTKKDSNSGRANCYSENAGHTVSIVCTNNGGGLQPRTVSLPHQVTAEKVKELLAKYPDTKAITIIKASNKNYEDIWLHNDWINYKK